MHITDMLKHEVNRKLSPSIAIPTVDQPRDPQNGYFCMDVFKDGTHVALCLWSETQAKFAIDFFSENVDDSLFEHPTFPEPHFKAPEEVVMALRQKLM
jgi:hypothetical protein